MFYKRLTYSKHFYYLLTITLHQSLKTKMYILYQSAMSDDSEGNCCYLSMSGYLRVVLHFYLLIMHFSIETAKVQRKKTAKESLRLKTD